jgi:hypothetical protein
MPRTSWRGFLRLSLTSLPNLSFSRHDAQEIRPPASRRLQINFEYPSLNYQFYGAFDRVRVDNPQHRGDLMGRCRLVVLHNAELGD